MTLVDELKKYKYAGITFHSPQFPKPVYSHLIASNDGFNWINIKDYNFNDYNSGWRDTDLHYINGLWWVCYTTDICYSEDLETFTKIPSNFKFKSVWAPELFKDKDGQWYLIYCGGNGKDDDWHIYMQKFYPDEKKLDDEVLKVDINESGTYIDANLNYIDGYYYLWLCCTSHDPHELRLYKSSSLLGDYERVQTNINQRVKEAGMVIDEAPEMLYRDGRYILYSDPYYHGLPELDRCVQYSISRDMKNWSELSKVSCTGNYNPRHFTPYYIGDIWQEDSSGDNGKVSPKDAIKLWDGNPGTLNETNKDNFTYIQSLVDRINQLSKNNPLFDEYDVHFDLELLPLLNRDVRVQFLENAHKLEKLMPTLMRKTLVYAGIIDYEVKAPIIPTALYFDKAMWNNYWQAVVDNLELVFGAINTITGGSD